MRRVAGVGGGQAKRLAKIKEAKAALEVEAKAAAEARAAAVLPPPQELAGPATRRRNRANRIEHRLFCYITQNWRGRPLTDRMAIVELIGATTTKAGLRVECALDTRAFEKGIKVSDAEMAALNITGGAILALRRAMSDDADPLDQHESVG